MAKLENVKILDMVNGEPTRVEYNGAIYVKTEEKAKEGDLVRVIDEDSIGYVTQGGFYKTYIDGDDDLVFDDDDGDERVYYLNDHALETFRKVSETKASADLAERLAELERQLEALEESVKPTTKEMAAKAESAPKFEVGDYVVPLPEADEEYMVTNTKMKLGKVVYIYKDGEIRIKIIAHENVKEINKEYDVNSKHFRQATDEEIRFGKINRKPDEFKKGDIVRVTDSCGGRVETGTITEVVYIDSDGDFTVRDEDGDDWYVEAELIVPVEQRFDLTDDQKVGARQ